MTLVSQALSGISVYTAYSTDIFKSIVGFKAAIGLSSLQMVLQIVTSLFCGYLMERFGRKKLYFYTMVANFMSALALSVSSFFHNG